MPCCARVGAFFLILLLASCGSYVQHVKKLKSCKLHCAAVMRGCQFSCRNNCQNCTTLANAETSVHFNQYKHQQNVQGSIVALELQSFRDPLQCRKPTCDCMADFGVCMQSCQGKIRKRLKVVQPC